MYMDEVSFVIVEMDSILGFYSFSDIASAHFFHVYIFAKIPSFSIDICGKIRMPVNLIRSWSENIGEAYAYSKNNEKSENVENFFHRWY